jgi:hypothetical protein
MSHDRIDTSIDDSLVPFFLEPNDWHGKGIDLHRESYDPPARDVERESEKRNESIGFWQKMKPEHIKGIKTICPTYETTSRITRTRSHEGCPFWMIPLARWENKSALSGERLKTAPAITATVTARNTHARHQCNVPAGTKSRRA